MTWLTWSNLYIALAFLSALMWLAAASVRLPKTAWFEAGAEGGRPSSEFNAILKKLRTLVSITDLFAPCLQGGGLEFKLQADF